MASRIPGQPRVASCRCRWVQSSRWFLLALVVWLLCTAAFVTPTLGDLGGDSAQYLMLADALGRGAGYVDAHLPDAPPHVHYPPGFAALLAPVVALCGVHAYLVVKLLLVAAMAFGFWCAFRFLRARAGDVVALWAVVLAMSAPTFALDGGRIRSEAVLLPLLYLTLAAAETSSGSGAGRARVWGLAVAATLVRLAAAPLLLLPGLCAWSRGRVRALGWFAAGALPLVLWFLWTRLAAHGGTQDYATEVAASPLLAGGVAGALRWVAEGLWLYGRGPGWILAHAPVGWLGDVLMVPVTALWLVGLGRRLWQGARPAEVFLVLELLALAAAPQREGRYVTPLLPLFALYVVEAVQWLAARLPRVRVPLVPASAAALVFVHLLALAPLMERRLKGRVVRAPGGVALQPVDMAQWEEGILQGDDPDGEARVLSAASLLQLAEWIRTRLPADAVLCSRFDRTLALLTGRRVVPLPAARTGREALAALQARGVTHVVDDGRMLDTRRFLDRLREAGDPPAVTTLRTARCLTLP